MVSVIGSNRSVTDLPPGFKPRPDNLITMLFLAALFHSVLILGVSFTSGNADSSSSEATAVEVVLLNRDYEKRVTNAEAEYIAQQNLVGAGNTTTEDELRVAYGRNSDPFMPGPEQEGVQQPSQQSTSASNAEELLHARTAAGGTLNKHSEDGSEISAPQKRGMPGTANSIEILAAPDLETVMQGAKPRQLIISANTRESRIAAYLDGWKRRVERVGTINFPRALLQSENIGNPVLEVSIGSNGKLNEVTVLSSSGNRELDMAAVDILRLASPFDPFPEYLRNDYDSLNFSYEWRFSGNSVSRMRVPR
jgi:protein TonB